MDEDDEELKKKWEKLDSDVKEIYTFEKLKETNRYNNAIFRLKFIKACYGLLFDLFFMSSLYPAAIWNNLGWLFSKIGLCNGTSGDFFEIIVIGVIFAFIMMAIEIAVFSGLHYLEMFAIEKTFGFCKQT